MRRLLTVGMSVSGQSSLSPTQLRWEQTNQILDTTATNLYPTLQRWEIPLATHPFLVVENQIILSYDILYLLACHIARIFPLGC